MSNPLVGSDELPPFSAIRAEHIEPAVRTLIAEHRRDLESRLASGADTWDTLVAPLEEMHHRLARTWSPVGHLNAVLNSDALRAAYNACLPLLTAWHTELGQNEPLFQAYSKVLAREGAALNEAQHKLLSNALRDFKLAGVDLPAERKQRFKALMEELATLQANFDEHVLDATNAWHYHTEDERELEGLPQPIVARAANAAQADGKQGWLFSLDPPNYQAILSQAAAEPLRQRFYEAWTTRASDQGPNAGGWDNSTLMEQILARRHELAAIVGFSNYVQYSLATKMARSVGEVHAFLEQLAEKSRPVAEREFAELTSFAGRTLNAWDVAYYAEQLKRQRLNVSEEALRPYFPVPRVLDGLFKVAERLYGVRIVERKDVDRYHPDAQFFDILNTDGSRRAGFFIDLYARPKKRGGAWMDECVGRKRIGTAKALPVAYLVCNFMPPGEKQPSLLTHSEVVTLFHEFGHGLHHMLTQVDFPSVAGINGVPWDAVELPSQFMENFAWQPQVLPLISGHVDSGEPLPQVELERLLRSRTFQAGMQTVRQLEFALFDLRIHAEYQPAQGGRIAPILNEVRERVAVIKPPAFNRFPNSFQHIFSGGYAAGYYSYKWAEVLAADAFSAFEERGIFDAATAQRFLHSILERGGSRDAMDAFIEFRGRKPEIEPLLKQLGLAA